MEKWKSIEGYEGLYEVSSLGRVKSLAKLAKYRTGNHRPIRERICSPSRVVGRYVHAALSRGGVTKTFLLHRLVAAAFCEKPKGSECVNHKNCDKWDNRAENLEWCTQRSNVIHSVNAGRRSSRKGQLHPMASMDNAKASKVKAFLRSGGLTQKQIADKFGITVNIVRDISANKSWRPVA